MYAALLAVGFFAFALYFILKFSRALLWSASKIKLSADVYALTGLDQANAYQTAYTRVCLLLTICPPIRQRDPLASRLVLRLLRLYYRVLQFLDALSASVGPCFTAWFRRERLACLHFSAVLLEDRITSNREFLSQYLNNGFHA